jgi:hypothetical protein
VLIVTAIACDDGPGGSEDGSDDDANEECSNGAPCLEDSDCPGGTRCNEEECTRLFCVETGLPCSTSDVCVSRECVSTPSGRVCWTGSRPEGWSCVDDTYCVSDLVCVDGECATAVAEMEVAPRSLEFVMVEGEGNPASRLLTIGNPGTAPLSFETSEDASWLQVSGSGLPLAAGYERVLELNVDGTGLTAGELTTTLIVEAEGAVGSPAEVDITFSIVPPPPPPTCMGTPDPCTGRAASACTDGCAMGMGCLGQTAIDCTASPANLECNFCNSIVGCACDASSVCGPAPEEGPARCASQINQTTCSQFGCGWGTTCTGTPAACETYDTTTCPEALGCTVG